MPSKFLRALVALAIVTLPATAFAAAPRNLLLNPGFERQLPGHDWMPASWDTSSAGMSTVFFGRDTLLRHGGQYGVSIANTSTVFPMGHNWSQTLLVGREAWDKTATFSVWSFSAGQEGRAYVLLQAYSDTVTKLARIWDVPRDEALRRLGVVAINDPLKDLGWKRLQFEGGDAGWVRREVRIYVPSGTNVLFVRCGLFGTGQVAFDDASLTLEPAGPAPEVPLGQNLFIDPGFEQRAHEWEWAVPPFEGAPPTPAIPPEPVGVVWLFEPPHPRTIVPMTKAPKETCFIARQCCQTRNSVKRLCSPPSVRRVPSQRTKHTRPVEGARGI